MKNIIDFSENLQAYRIYDKVLFLIDLDVFHNLETSVLDFQMAKNMIFRLLSKVVLILKFILWF